MSKPTAGRFARSQPKAVRVFRRPGSSTPPALERRWWRESSAYRRCNTVPPRWRCGRTSKSRSKSRERHSTWIRSPRNIWNGFGKFRSAPTASASDTWLRARRSRPCFHEQSRTMADLLTIYLGSNWRNSRASTRLCNMEPSARSNWLMAGEAASLVDPMTSNGVTAALRHASEAAALILKFRKRGELPLRARRAYSRRILQTAKFFNEGIEKIIYEPAVRNRIGLPVAGAVYTSPAWSMNVVYARMHPDGMLSTFLLGAMLGFFRISASMLYRFCRMLKSPVVAELQK